MFWRAILYFMDVTITTLYVQLCVIYVCLCVHGRERDYRSILRISLINIRERDRWVIIVLRRPNYMMGKQTDLVLQEKKCPRRDLNADMILT